MRHEAGIDFGPTYFESSPAPATVIVVYRSRTGVGHAIEEPKTDSRSGQSRIDDIIATVPMRDVVRAGENGIPVIEFVAAQQERHVSRARS